MKNKLPLAWYLLGFSSVILLVCVYLLQGITGLLATLACVSLIVIVFSIGYICLAD